jgi:hypothetical protein
MRGWVYHSFVVLFLLCLFSKVALAADISNSGAKIAKSTLKSESYSLKNDIAFVSVMGSRPDVKSLKGFQKAILFNAQGAKVKEITFSKNDSIFSLDKMLQENKSKGPLLIRMYH